ncbi:MAG: hypothetical protein EXR16_05525, partial [Bacteroidetes bacterium]|nr:hypothetical protein [Bacteroidota bacterium]
MSFFNEQSATQHINAVTDTLQSTSHEGGSKEVFVHLFEHLQDGKVLEIPFGHINLPQFPPVTLLGITFDFSITKHIFFLLLASLLLIVTLLIVSRKNRKS